MSTDETITQAELAEALKRVRDSNSGLPALHDPEVAAAGLFANVRAHREPGPDEITMLRNACQTLGRSVIGLMRAMEAARIEAAQGHTVKAMEWILNSLPDVWDGPEGTDWDGHETAQEWFDRTESAYKTEGK